MQQKSFVYFFYATADAATALAASCDALQANRNDFYFAATQDGRG